MNTHYPKTIIHLSPNRYGSLSNDFFTQKIWRELSKGAERYVVISRSSKFGLSIEAKENILLIRIPSIFNRALEYYFSGVIGLLLSFFIINKKKNIVLIAQSGFYCFWPIFIGKVLGLKTILEIHGDVYFSSKGVYSLIRRIHFIAALNLVDIIRSLSPSMSEKLNAFKSKLRYVPNRADERVFRPIKTNYTIGSPITIISVGRFVPQKGYEEMLKVLSNFSTPIKVILIGGGSLKEKYLKVVERSNLDLHLVDWLPQHRLIKFLRSADIYIQPSISGMGEAMPRTIVEAMALGLPIIASNASFIKGILDETNSILYDSEEQTQILQKLHCLIADSNLRARIGIKANDDFMTNYSWNKAFGVYRKMIYEEA